MKKLYILAATFLGLASVNQTNAQCNGRYQTDIYANVDVTSNIQYGSNLDLDNNNVNLMMDIYQPQGDTATNRPVIIFAHGGSFYGGTKTDADIVFFCTEMAKKGYVCASISYRLTGSIFDLISEETTVKVVFNAIQDGKAAIRFFRQDAATINTYKIDPDQIFIGGTSAGGILGINLTYADDINKLSTPWQTWANEIGGLEGNSGNPGYCSRSNGTFGFAGAIADTSYIESNDVPWYGSHSEDDATVQYGYGQPLNGFNPVNLSGSELLNIRLTNLGIYNHFDSYTGSDHPPFANSASIMADNKDSLAMFLYNILDCNPNNLKKATQKTCASNPTNIDLVSNTSIIEGIYPNPFEGVVNISLKDISNTNIFIYNTMGQLVINEKANQYIQKIDLSNFPNGAYFIKVTAGNDVYTKTIIKQ